MLPRRPCFRYGLAPDEFFSALFDELVARRRRLRGVVGGMGQSLFEFAVVAALLAGSLGLIVRAWMPKAAPWGFALPFLFLLGYALLDWRRQAELKAGQDEARVRTRYDLAALFWTLLLAGGAVWTFVYAFGQEPPPPPPAYWVPPDSTVNFDFGP